MPMGTAAGMPCVFNSPPWPRFPAEQHLQCHVLFWETTRDPAAAEGVHWDGKLNGGEHGPCMRMEARNNLTVVPLKYSGNLGIYLLMPTGFFYSI